MSLLVFYKTPNSTVLRQIAFDGSTWSDLGELKPTTPGAPEPPPFTTPPLKSDHTPAAAIAAPVTGTLGRLTLVYKAAGSTGLRWTQSEGSFWINDQPIENTDGSLLPPKSDQGPAVAFGNNSLMMVFKAENSNDLCFAWMGPDKGQQTWHLGQTVSSYTNGLVAPKSNVSPSVAYFKNKLYAIYKGESSDDLYFFTYDLTTLQWSGNVKISSQPGPIEPKSNYAPSLAVFNDRLYMIYKGPNTNGLNYAVFDGTTWSGNSLISGQPGRINPESSSNPGIAVFNGLLYLIYRGPNSNDLNMATFDGTTWAHNTQIFNLGGNIHPQSDINPAIVSYPYDPLPTP